MTACRFEHNPILIPNKKQSWEAEAVFNGCPVQKENKIFLVYRALSLSHYHSTAKMQLMVSDIGIAESKDGTNFYNRKRFIVPEYEWEKNGCEDPRIIKFNNKYYIFYTAIANWPPKAETIRIGLAISKDLKKIDSKHLITPFNAKAMALFPEKINGKIWTILTINTDSNPPAKICLASFDQENELWSEERWHKWYNNFPKYVLNLQRRPEDNIEIGAPPLKTKYGWLLIYSYIKNYFSGQKIFSAEAVLLDLKNPLKIIAKTDFPLITPEEYYEKYGMVNNVIFPSGAIITNDIISLYYGAADTTCCLAYIKLSSLLDQMLNKKNIPSLVRSHNNPVISPIKENFWEAKATFNPAAIYLNKTVHLIYRAMSKDNTSVFGYATSKDGININYRSKEPVYTPRESFESKLQSESNSGVEDPRLALVDNKLYMFYTAFDGKNPPRIALTWINPQDFIKQKWVWSHPVLISPPNLDNKDAAMFPEKIKNKYIIIHRNGNDIDLSFHSTLNFDGTNWLEEYRWLAPRKGWWDSLKTGIAAPPIKTNKGWLLLYHGVSEDDGVYRLGAALTDLQDPVKIIGRTDYPILEPETSYEKDGIVSNVVFPCGAVLINKTLFVYYGGADKVIGIATIDINKLLNIFKLYKC